MPTVLVDDSFTTGSGIPLIAYGGSTRWQINGRPGFDNFGTTHGATVAGQWAAFSFTGTQVTVFGTLDVPGPAADRAAPVSQYSIDGGSPVKFNTSIIVPAPTDGPSANNTFFRSDILTQGNHTLLIEILQVDSGHNYWLDYLTFETNVNPPPTIRDLVPTDGSLIDPGAPYTVVVDDSDPGAVAYTGSWITGKALVGQEFNSTTHGADQADFNASFIFTGTQVSVFGTIDAPGSLPNETAPHAAFIIDGGTPTFFNQSGDSSYFTGDSAKNLSLFASPTLQQGTHTLTIAVQSVNPGHNLWLDYLTYQVDERPAAQVMAPPPGSSRSSLPSASAGKSSSNVGPIVGGVVGGLVVLALGVVVAILLLRRDRKTRKRMSIDAAPAPFTAPSHQPSAYHDDPRQPDSYAVPTQSSMTTVPGALPTSWDSSSPLRGRATSNGAQSSAGGSVAGTSSLVFANIGYLPGEMDAVSPPAYEDSDPVQMSPAGPSRMHSSNSATTLIPGNARDRKDPRLFARN